ncbi:hypothetical protein P3592_13560 [Vibrio parahaemolyticus]|nr:hypothetical protein [Vibrio parahaemolyticus]MDF4810008.1 hypothetical protein [Vibrio parahaemolyticus]MDF4852808.1 hypothetical protein [Vibrio parahaemolyticus]
MKLIQWTLFIDMLGYRDINGNITDEASAKDFLDFMESNKHIFDFQNNDDVKKRYKNDDQFNLYEFYDVQYSFVSDSFILTLYPKEVESLDNVEKMYMHSANALYIITMRLQDFIFNCFSKKGVFLRGGISNKYCYIRENFAVGEGLIEAYKIESSVAKYPRIAVSEHIINNYRLMNALKFLEYALYNANKLILRDSSDGVHFLDYIGYQLSTIDTTSAAVRKRVLKNRSGFDFQHKLVAKFIEVHANILEAKLTKLYERQKKLKGKEKESVEKVIEKFEWLKEHHNKSVISNNLVSHLTVS